MTTSQIIGKRLLLINRSRQNLLHKMTISKEENCQGWFFPKKKLLIQPELVYDFQSIGHILSALASLGSKKKYFQFFVATCRLKIDKYRYISSCSNSSFSKKSSSTVSFHSTYIFSYRVPSVPQLPQFNTIGAGPFQPTKSHQFNTPQFNTKAPSI